VLGRLLDLGGILPDAPDRTLELASFDKARAAFRFASPSGP